MSNARELLQHEFQKRKGRNPNFSLRAFARWLGLSPAQLSQMMTGKRPVTLKSMKKIGARLGLSPSEKKTFLSAMLKTEGLLETEQDFKFLKMEEDQFRLISDWYHFAILALTRVKGAIPDPRWIARRLGIGADEANQALLRMVRMGIIETHPHFRQIGSPVEVVSETPSSAIRKYHKQSLNMAIEKVDLVPVHLRQLQSLSIPVNPRNLPAYRKLIDDFLAQASELAESQAGSEIYQLNVQLFPVTQLKEDKP